LIGGKTGVEYRTITHEVTVLVTGRNPTQSTHENEVSVLVDVSGINAGESAQLVPMASILESGSDVTTSVLPAQIDVDALAHATSEPSSG